METDSLETRVRLLDQRLARRVVAPLVSSPLHPNVLTTATLAIGIAAAACFVQGDPTFFAIGAGLFMFAVFSDHLDGELARAARKTSRFGHVYDFVVGGMNYTMLFSSIGIGLAPEFGPLALWLGFGAASCNPLIMVLRLRMDNAYGLAATEHPDFGWFNLEDIIYLIGPITWLAGIEYFFVIFGLGTIGYLVWTTLEYRRWFARQA